MLILIAILVCGALLYRRNLRLEGTAETTPDTHIHATVDGEPVDTYIQ